MDTAMHTSKKHPFGGLNWLLLELEKYTCSSFLLEKCKDGKKALKINVDLM